MSEKLKKEFETFTKGFLPKDDCNNISDWWFNKLSKQQAEFEKMILEEKEVPLDDARMTTVIERALNKGYNKCIADIKSNLTGITL